MVREGVESGIPLRLRRNILKTNDECLEARADFGLKIIPAQCCETLRIFFDKRLTGGHRQTGSGTREW
jgi:hypothetical protein